MSKKEMSAGITPSVRLVQDSVRELINGLISGFSWGRGP